MDTRTHRKPIDPREIALRAAAPLRGNRKKPMRPQDDASGLALFMATNEPPLL